MSQPVKLSDALVLEARVTAAGAQRSIAGQIEYWADLGRAIEGLLRGRELLALRRSNATKPLAECMASIRADKDRQRVKDYLKSRPFPHFEAAPGRPGLLLRIEADGTRTVGRFVNRKFKVVPEKRTA